MMKKEGWKLGLALVAVVTLFVAGSIIVRPFPWLKAYEYNIVGQLEIDGKAYAFDQNNPLIIDNVRSIQGVAVATDGSKVYFDSQGGAEVKADQLGYLEGMLFSSDKGIIEFGLQKNRLAKIDMAGDLSGDFLLDDGTKVVLAGKTSWRPYELNKVSLPEEVKLGVNSSTRLDPVILGLGGRNLYDVQTRWVSNDKNVQVDEYGYVTVSEPGDYQDAVVLQVGEEKRAVTLAVTQGIDKILVKPSVVLAPAEAQDFDLSIEPASMRDQLRTASGVTIEGKFINSANKEVSCSSFDKNSMQLKGCIFAVAEDAGSWNLEFTVDEGGQQGKYVFPGVLTVIKKDNALNISMLANVYNNATTTAEADINPDNIIKLEAEDDGSWYRYLRYKAIVTWPSFLLPTSDGQARIESGILNVTFFGKGVGVGLLGVDKCNVTEGLPAAFSMPVSNIQISGESTTFDIPLTGNEAFEMKANLVQGCDLVADLTGNFNIVLSDGTRMDGIKGDAEVRTAIAGRKRVSITGDVIVEEGDLQIKRLEEDQNLYLLVASEEVKASGGQGENGSVSDYQLNGDSTYTKMISTLRDKVDKLIIERGTPIDIANNTAPLQQFLLGDKQKNPEGRIFVNNNATGTIYLKNRDGNSLNICAPTTLVVYGRDVVIEDDIVMNNANDSTCVERGNFGLIVFDGDIHIRGDEADSEGNNAGDPVNAVEGFYFTTGTMYTGASHQKFALNGVAFAHDYVLERY